MNVFIRKNFFISKSECLRYSKNSTQNDNLSSLLKKLESKAKKKKSDQIDK